MKMLRCIEKVVLTFVTRGVTPAVQLTRKLISALEAIEKLPVFSYDLPGSGYGLQVIKLSVSFHLIQCVLWPSCYSIKECHNFYRF